jgi:peroxiredoxin
MNYSRRHLFVRLKVWLADPLRRVQGALALMSVALLGSVVINVVLAQRLRNFMHRESLGGEQELLKIGTLVPPFVLQRLDGRTVEINYLETDRPTVLYVFTPPCKWCLRNVGNIDTLVDRRKSEYRFIGISLSDAGLAQYVSINGFQMPVYTGLPPEVIKVYKLGITPQTIVVSPGGQVLQNWIGAYVGEQKSQVEAFFHVSLPGLRDLPKPGAAKN